MRMEVDQLDAFCSLDMLAEVASATLQNDPSFIFPVKERKVKTRKSKINVCGISKRSVNSFEKLTLDQIKGLTDKMLVEKFSEFTSDEIRKKYSFKCFLMPDKCSQVFNSFGNETRARCKIKAHLLSHVNELISEVKDESCQVDFTAEPLHVRKKRLNEATTRCARKKKLKLNRKRKETLYEHNGQKICDSATKRLKFGRRDAQTLKKRRKLQKGSKSSKISQTENYVNTNVSYQDLKELSCDSVFLPAFDGTAMSENFKHFSGENSVVFPNHTDVKNNQQVKNYLNGQKVCFKKSEYTVKWNVDLENNSVDSAYIMECINDSEPDACIPFYHDHTYTTANGKTFNCDLSSATDNSRVVSKLHRDRKKSHRSPFNDASLIIPTPPFPYVYIPLLPHIAEIKEVGCCSESCSCSNEDFFEDLHESINSCTFAHLFSNSNEVNLSHVNPTLISENETGSDDDEDDNENTLSEIIGDGSEEEVTSEASDCKVTEASVHMEELLKSDCPENLQAVEKKLALKCIRALRTKKKEERGPLVCQICKNKSFTAQATLMYHYRSHAGLKPEIPINVI